MYGVCADFATDGAAVAVFPSFQLPGFGRARCGDPERSGHAGHQCAGVRLLFPASYDGGPLGAAPGRVPRARGGSGAGHSPVLVSLGTARHRAVGVCGSEKWEGGLPVAVLLGSAPGLEVSALGYDCIRRA